MSLGEAEVLDVNRPTGMLAPPAYSNQHRRSLEFSVKTPPEMVKRWEHQRRPRAFDGHIRSQSCREVAAHFRSLADVEPAESLRQQLERLAARHDQLAADFKPRHLIK